MGNLKKLRKNAGLSQRDFAQKLNIAKATYARYEIGESEPPFEVLIKFADYFNCSIDYLLDHQTKNTVQLDSLTKNQQLLLDDIKDLSEQNCQRVRDFIFGITLVEDQKQEVIKKFNSKGE